jgi:hypothetical protein
MRRSCEGFAIVVAVSCCPFVPVLAAVVTVLAVGLVGRVGPSAHADAAKAVAQVNPATNRFTERIVPNVIPNSLAAGGVVLQPLSVSSDEEPFYAGEGRILQELRQCVATFRWHVSADCSVMNARRPSSS